MHSHDIKKIGPGGWYMIHLICIHAKSIDSKKGALEMINTIKEHFFCLECRNHFREFTESNPPIRYCNEENGLFIWSVNAHNNVNRMNNKPEMSIDDALELYLGSSGSCVKDCGKGGESKSIIRVDSDIHFPILSLN